VSEKVELGEKLLRRSLEIMTEWQQHQGYEAFLACERKFVQHHSDLKKYFEEKDAPNKASYNYSDGY